jgi:hypothetical protein
MYKRVDGLKIYGRMTRPIQNPYLNLTRRNCYYLAFRDTVTVSNTLRIRNNTHEKKLKYGS